MKNELLTNYIKNGGQSIQESMFDKILPLNSSQGLQYTILKNNLDVRMFLQMIESKYKYNVIASPKINTSNNKPAIINISEERPFIKGKLKPSDANAGVEETFEYKDVGVILEVKPRINQKKDITLDLHQTIKSIINSNNAQQFADVVAKREITTSVVIQNNQTLVIGGIIQKSAVSSEKRVPLLSSIPIIGKLFSSSSSKDVKTELLILITPKVIDQASDDNKQYETLLKEFPKSMK